MMDKGKIFSEYNFNNAAVLELCKKYNYLRPSEIQRRVIEDYIKRKDLTKTITMISSEAGSGKTLAYLIMLLEFFDITSNNLQAIIILPTRELALQVEEYFIKLSTIKYKVFIGGKANIPGKTKKEKINFQDMPQVIIGTLGKVKSLLINKGKLLPNKRAYNFLSTVIIDEADKMLDQNFNNNYKDFFTTIVAELFSEKESALNEESSGKKQLILCSASLTENALKFYSPILPTEISTSLISVESAKSKEKNITEYYYVIPADKHVSYYEQKYKMIFKILSTLQSQYKQCIIFYNKKGKGEELAMDLRSYNFSVSFIHGDLTQDQRQLIFESISKMKVKIIISTDLLSRGIDLSAVNLVINFDLPYNEIDYSHRVGRTGRFFTKGIAINFIQENEINDAERLGLNTSATLIKNFDEEWLNNLKIKFEDIEKDLRITKEEKEEISKLNKGNISLEDIEIINQKRRREKYEKEAVINDWESVEDEKEKKKCSKKFCLYCDLLKIFDV